MRPGSPPEARGAGRGRATAVSIALPVVLAVALAGAEGAQAQAAPAFPEVPYTPERPVSYAWAYASLGAGLALIGGSFILGERADDAYRDYLAATDPATIETLYDRAVRYDRLGSASLLGGEVLLVTGLYLRFLRSPRPPRVSLAVAPDRCALSWRF